MQFIIKFQLSGEKQILPLNYHYPLSSWIYKIMAQEDDEFARFLHDQDYQLPNLKAFKWQLKYYIYILQQAGIENVTGILEYPKIKKTKAVNLSPEDIKKIQAVEHEIKQIIQSDIVLKRLNKPLCRRCSYYDFCYVGDIDE